MSVVLYTSALGTFFFVLGMFHPSVAYYEKVNEKDFEEPLIFTAVYVLMLFFCYKTVANASRIERSDEVPLNTDHMFFCETCQQSIPVRAGHCRKCGCCCLRRDHHCPWLGVCICMDNHLYYVLLLICCLVFGILSARSCSQGAVDRKALVDWLLLSMPCTLGYYLSLVLLVQPVLLIPFHLYLMGSNRTTWELLRGQSISYLRGWTKSMSPFSRGLFGNIFDFLTMHFRHPTYSVPSTEEELEIWRNNNIFWSNDYYEC